MMIPGLMVAGPIAGLLIGWLVRKLTGWGDWVLIVFLFIGLVAGGRETIQVIRRLK
jgi:F0F1-type ATP synthase assembly protein I